MRSALSLLLIGAAFSSAAQAQDFTFEAPIGAADSTAYHRIVLPAQVTCHLAPINRGVAGGFRDVRLYNGTGREIPFVQEQEARQREFTNYHTYPIYKTDYSRSWRYESRVYIERDTPDPINHLVLKIRNFDDDRFLRLSGSDDGKQWFIVKDGFSFRGGAYSDTSTHAYRVVRFPLSDYQYFKLEVDESYGGRHPDHIQISAAGYFTSDYDHGRFVPVPTPSLYRVIKQEDKETELFFNFGDAHYLDRLQFDIEEDEPFHRKAELYEKNWVTDSTFRWEYVRTFWLSSNHLNTLEFQQYRLRDGKVVIHDKDNYPLQIKAMRGLQLRYYLIAKLKTGEIYHLEGGNEQVSAPEYDLEYFRQQIPAQLPELTAQEPNPIDVKDIDAKEAEAAKEVKPFFETKAFLWTMIGVVMAFFGYMAIRMMSDLQKREAKNQSGPDTEEPTDHQS